MVVDHVQNDSESSLVCLIDKSLQRLVITVHMCGGVQIDPVVSPVPSAGKFRAPA